MAKPVIYATIYNVLAFTFNGHWTTDDITSRRDRLKLAATGHGCKHGEIIRVMNVGKRLVIGVIEENNQCIHRVRGIATFFIGNKFIKSDNKCISTIYLSTSVQ